MFGERSSTRISKLVRDRKGVEVCTEDVSSLGEHFGQLGFLINQTIGNVCGFFKEKKVKGSVVIHSKEKEVFLAKEGKPQIWL